MVFVEKAYAFLRLVLDRFFLVLQTIKYFELESSFVISFQFILRKRQNLKSHRIVRSAM